MLMVCLVMVIIAAGAKWQMGMIQKRRQRDVLTAFKEREDIGRRRGEAELKVEEAALQERSISTDIREFTHELTMMSERLLELRAEEDELEARRQKDAEPEG